MKAWVQSSAAVLAILLAGCKDSTAPRDTTPPASPRGVYSITGDHEVFLKWVDNTEQDLAGYRIYESSCASGPDCPYDRIGATSGTSFTVTGLGNGVTRYFAVSAVDLAGNESRLSPGDVFDTPRPEGSGRSLDNYLEAPATSGWDFPTASVRPNDDTTTDIFFGANNGVFLIFTPFTDTDIQDAGYATTLDAIDFAPAAGWAPSGTAEAIPGHCYIVRTFDNHFAKIRITSLTTHRLDFDWAYQVDPGNRELRAQRVGMNKPRVRRTIRWQT